MGIYLADQVKVFLQAVLVGASLGFFYDIFRISRIAFPTAEGVIFVEDVLYFAVCAIVTFFFGLSAIDGTLRIFLIIGELLGAILYFMTLGKIVMSVAKKIIEAVKALLRFIARWILRPVWLAFYYIIAFIMRPFIFLFQKFKKIWQNFKFSLKVKRKVLYNQLAGYFLNKKAVKKRGKHKKERKNEKAQKTGA